MNKPPPERLDHFMARAAAAYYARHDPFQDFITAPEIGQAFGEVLGAFAAVVWQMMGAPDPVLLAEAGPGRGTLMEDALRAVGKVMPGFRAALRLHLIETSPRLRDAQRAKLPDATWHDTIAELPPGPLILLGNEFLDALPIRQFVRRGDVWLERYVAEDRFVECLAAPLGFAAPEGTVVEVCDAAQEIVSGLAARLAAEGGLALFLDYGHAASAPGDTLQALRDGQPADPLADPGAADITAHVDFGALASAARAAGAAVHGPVEQGAFLTKLGLFQRTERLALGQPPERATALRDAAARLAGADRMGRLFKVMAISDPALPMPPGFEP
ncbi:MAG TPA: SAM-dependent methyltransferase [Acetobacteraceae bacterium]|nr:SAM-dependent methyltransferase [Acetobacteraceae bacterium]